MKLIFGQTYGTRYVIDIEDVERVKVVKEEETNKFVVTAIPEYQVIENCNLAYSKMPTFDLQHVEEPVDEVKE